MKLSVLGSGSGGNAIAVSRSGSTVLVDVGFGPRTIRRRLKRAAIQPESVRGIVLTHEHGDHARGASAMAKALRCPVVATAGTLRALASELAEVETRALSRDGLTLDTFRVEMCRTQHDASEPVAVVVADRSGHHRFGIAHDVGHATAELQGFLTGCTGIVLEANHDDEMLASGPYPPALRARIAGRFGHLSNASAAQLAAGLTHAHLDFVVLAHLSRHCNRPDLAYRAVVTAMGARGFTGRVIVADQDTPMVVLPRDAETQYALELG